jgi:signal peptidase I
MKINGEIRLIHKVLKKYGLIELPAQGNSMFPLIKQDDICTFETCNPFLLNRGDVVLFFSTEGQLITHRFLRIVDLGDKQVFIFKGDTNVGTDDPILEEQIIGRLTYIRRSKKSIPIGGLIVKYWSVIVLSIPLISYLLRFYLNKKETAIYK